MFKDKHKGQTAYITAKGPSIEYLQREDIGDGIIIAMNESIKKIDELKLDNEVYSLQVDIICDPHCNASIILHKNKSAKEHDISMQEYYVIDPEKDFNEESNRMSSILSIELAQLMGCTKIVMVSFDSYTMGLNNYWLGDGTAGLSETITKFYLGQVLGLNNFIADNNINVRWFTPLPKRTKKGVKLIIATPFQDKAGYSPYIESMVKMVKLLTELTVDYEFWPFDGRSNKDISRNRLLAKFMLSDATDILFIDSNMSWNIDGNEAFINIIGSPYEVTAGGYPLRYDQELYRLGIDTDDDGNQVICPKTGMLQGTRCSGGFMRIKRSCIEKMQEAYPETQYLDNVDDKSMLVHNLFENGIHDRYFYDGDYNFCRRWEAIGGKVWIEPRITFGNYGVKEWKGSYHEFLLSQPGGSNDPARLLTLAKQAEAA